MLFSKSCEYGIRAALYLAYHPDESKIPIREISDKLDISFHFLTKILQVFTQEGLILSFKGAKGGVSLARPSDKITIYELVLAIDTEKIFNLCVLGLPGCGQQKPCPLHHEWEETRTKLKVMLNSTTLKELAEKVRTHDYRLAEGLDLNSVLK